MPVEVPSLRSRDRPAERLPKRIAALPKLYNLRAAPGSSSITANHLELGLEPIGVDQGRYMTGFDRVRDGFFDERPCQSDLTKLPLVMAR